MCLVSQLRGRRTALQYSPAASALVYLPLRDRILRTSDTPHLLPWFGYLRVDSDVQHFKGTHSERVGLEHARGFMKPHMYVQRLLITLSRRAAVIQPSANH